MSEISGGKKTQLVHKKKELKSKDNKVNINYKKIYLFWLIRRRRDPRLSDCSEDEIQQAINYMRRNIPTAANKQEMIEYFSITGVKRAAMVADGTNSATEILHCYPRLRDLYEAVILLIFQQIFYEISIFKLLSFYR